MALIIYGVGSFEKRESAVLRLQWGLQVGAVVDGVRPGVAGEQFKTFREALLKIDGERVIPGAGIGKLCVDAVEGNWNSETGRITGKLRQSHLSAVAASGRSK